MSETLRGTPPKAEPVDGAAADIPFSLVVELTVQDPDTVAALTAFPEGPERDEFALAALKIGVLALRQARGQVDARAIERECDRLLADLQRRLDDHGSAVNRRLTDELRSYFDPETGRFHERVHSLLKRDGELETVLRRLVAGEDSEFCRLLARHVGQESPLLKLLTPGESNQLLAALRQVVEAQLADQRERVLSQFSLDNPEGALSRLVKQLAEQQGALGGSLKEQIATVTREFSLDNEQSTLSRLKGLLEVTRQAIHANLTLDDESSALARLKRELETLLKDQAESSHKFQEEVKLSLEKLVTKRETERRGTLHGFDFEQALCEFLAARAQEAGDVAQATGNQVGALRNCKVGDCVVQLGPDSAAPSARIVVEAKQDAAYDVARAREELETARQNRQAEVGLFVFSRQTAPAGLEPISRYDRDVLVVWDAENPATDALLKAGLSLAKALCIRRARQSQAQTADFTAIEQAVARISQSAEKLDEVRSSAEQIKRHGDKILDRVRIEREKLERDVKLLEERLADLKQTLGTSDAAAS